MVKNLPAMQETWVRKIPWRRERLPTPVFLPAEFHGQRSLVGYSPWGRKESDTTERLTLTSLVYYVDLYKVSLAYWMPSKSEAQPLPYRTHPIEKALKQTIARSIHQPRDQAAEGRRRGAGKASRRRCYQPGSEAQRGVYHMTREVTVPTRCWLASVCLLSEQVLSHTSSSEFWEAGGIGHCCPPCRMLHMSWLRARWAVRLLLEDSVFTVTL